jgi:hypothetical protein
MTITISDRFRDDAVACLVQIVRDEGAPAAARASAARDLLAYNAGRPGQSRPIKAADLGRLSEDERQELFHALVTHYFPGGIQALLRESVDQALLALPAPDQPTTTGKYQFRRGAAKPSASQPTATAHPPAGA